MKQTRHRFIRLIIQCANAWFELTTDQRVIIYLLYAKTKSPTREEAARLLGISLRQLLRKERLALAKLDKAGHSAISKDKYLF